MKFVMLKLIAFYQYFLSPLKPPTCRFYPTCSTYAMAVIQDFGPWRGGWLALKRIIKCHPFHPGGNDFPPEVVELEQISEKKCCETINHSTK